MTIPIVVVDDDEVERQLVQRLVKSLEIDANLVQFADGDMFLEAILDSSRIAAEIGETPPRMLVLLDINMPQMNGFEVLDALQKDVEGCEKYLFVMMYSSSNHSQDRNDAMKYPFVKDYVVKPITAEKLEALIRGLYPEDDFA